MKSFSFPKPFGLGLSSDTKTAGSNPSLDSRAGFTLCSLVSASYFCVLFDRTLRNSCHLLCVCGRKASAEPLGYFNKNTLFAFPGHSGGGVRDLPLRACLQLLPLPARAGRARGLRSGFGSVGPGPGRAGASSLGSVPRGRARSPAPPRK